MGIRPTVESGMGKVRVAREAEQPEQASLPGPGSRDNARRRRHGAFLSGIAHPWSPMAALGGQGKAVAAGGVAAGAAAAEPAAEARRRDVPSWLAQVGMFTMVGVGIGV